MTLLTQRVEKRGETRKRVELRRCGLLRAVELLKEERVRAQDDDADEDTRT